MKKSILLIGSFLIPLLLVAQVDRFSEEEIQDQQQFLEALQLRILEKYDEAIEAFVTLEEADPLNDVIQFELAKLYWVKKQDKEAAKHGQRAVELNPERKAYKEFLIDLYSATRDYAALNETLQSFIDSGNFNESYYMQLARSYKKTGNFKESLNMLDELEQRVGYRKNIGQTRVSIYRVENNKRKMMREMERLLENFPADTNVLLQQAILLESIGEEQKALQVYEKILDIDPNNVAANRKITLGIGKSRSPLGILSSLEELVRNEQYPKDEKIKELATLVPRLKPGSSTTIEFLKLMDILQDMYPDDARVNALHGDVFFNTYQPEKAKKYYEKTIELDKSVFMVWKNLMMAQDNTGDFEKLKQTAIRAVDYFPNQAVCYYYAGKGEMMSDNPEAGREWLQEGMFLTRNNPTLQAEFHLMLTYYYLGKKQKDAAQREFQKVSGEMLGPRHAMYFEIKGDIEYLEGKFDAARESWEQALENGADNVRIATKIDKIKTTD